MFLHSEIFNDVSPNSRAPKRYQTKLLINVDIHVKNKLETPYAIYNITLYKTKYFASIIT